MKKYILVWKGYQWKNIFKLKSYELSYFFIQTLTLSRYVHTATLYKQDNKWYLLQALMFKGVVREETSIDWIRQQIKDNRVECFTINDATLDKIFSDNTSNMTTGQKYNMSGLFRQALFNIFGFGIKHSQVQKKSFCSELTAFCLGYGSNSMQYSPQDIVDLDILVHSNP